MMSLLYTIVADAALGSSDKQCHIALVTPTESTFQHFFHLIKSSLRNILQTYEKVQVFNLLYHQSYTECLQKEKSEP